MIKHCIVNIRGEQFLSSPILTTATQIEHAGKIEFHKLGKPYLRNLSVVNGKNLIINLSTPFLFHHTPLWKNTQQINNSTRLQHILKKLQMAIEYVALLGLYYEGSFFTEGEIATPSWVNDYIHHLVWDEILIQCGIEAVHVEKRSPVMDEYSIHSSNLSQLLWPLLLTWFNFNPSMDK